MWFPLKGIQEMSLARLHAVSQFDPGPGVIEGAGSREAWHVSSGSWLMPPDRLRLQRCVQRLRGHICVYVSVCLRDVTFIRIMGGKLHSWRKDFHGFVCLLIQIK